MVIGFTAPGVYVDPHQGLGSRVDEVDGGVTLVSSKDACMTQDSTAALGMGHQSSPAHFSAHPEPYLGTSTSPLLRH